MTESNRKLTNETSNRQDQVNTQLLRQTYHLWENSYFLSKAESALLVWVLDNDQTWAHIHSE